MLVSLCVSCTSNSARVAPIHVGGALENAETVEVVATLASYLPQAGTMDFENGAIVFDVSVFLIVEPKNYRGRRFVINHYSEPANAGVWREPDRTFQMVVHRDILDLPDGEELFPGPDYVSILREL
jgi:hypothetical protein